ncbi:SDR family oxidoreductase [Zunongwangia sp. SCSIO 43204]|uniref:SDR family oxidoreductase n=1 Tax=Zunongwangia sp. SCSIO 43204 TaxID=2779359 RepID=UPI001CA8EE47|nr:SDR family oxidoreductase [Zunongwangia sp. SCSIO 43204]UAB84546.1 SDR family oxidoreductase [Zunongwangia sp. SCSIO 43204]
MWNLNNKTALITGGSKGIGRACVEEFARLGASVIFTARNKEDILKLEEELRAKNYDVTGIVADAIIKEDQDKIAAAMKEKWGKLDILVNNAGINIRKKALEYTEDEYRKVIEINQFSVFELSLKLHPYLKISGNSKIVNIASSAAMQDVGTGVPYAMSKAAMLQQTRSLAVEWAADGIRVNAVSPWFTVTPLTKGLLAKEDRMNPILRRTPLKRVAEASEMANIAAFLAMDQSSYITGQNIVADGGMSINAI